VKNSDVDYTIKIDSTDSGQAANLIVTGPDGVSISDNFNNAMQTNIGTLPDVGTITYSFVLTSENSLANTGTVTINVVVRQRTRQDHLCSAALN
jgi:hypothetical protein